MTKTLRLFALCLLFALPQLGQTQISAERFNLFSLDSTDAKIASRKTILHGHIQPYIPVRDSAFDRLKGTHYPAKTNQLSLVIDPDIAVGSSFGPSHAIIGGGSMSVGPKFNIGNKLFGSVRLSYFREQLPNYLKEYSDSLRILPGIGYAKSTSNGYEAFNATGYVAFVPSKYFSLEAGNGKHFWGNGYRSLLLSTNSAPFPYLRFSTDIWHLKYSNLWIQTRDISRGENFKQAPKSYQAMHALSWNATPWLNLSIYEKVIWQENDSLSHRGLDMNYMNPIIFYRPVEYSLGSADNVIMGFSFNIKATNKHMVYGQMALDEFLMKEFTSRRGWWANKYAIQIGFKGFDLIKKGLNFQSEVNLARPFTYSHGSVLQNDGHLNQGLSHPLGANFYEWVNVVHYQKGPWSYRGKFIWAIFGRDREGENYSGNFGGNIFRPYTSPAKKYDNRIGQGLKSNFYYLDLTLSRSLNEKFKHWHVFGGATLRFDVNEYRNVQDVFLSLGIRGNLLPNYRDF